MLVQFGVFDVIEVHFGLKGHTHDGEGAQLCSKARGLNVGQWGWCTDLCLSGIIDQLVQLREIEV